MKKFTYIALLFTTLIFVFSCTKNDETTLILLGEEEYISDYSEVIPHFIERTDTILQTHDFYLDSVEEIMCDILGKTNMPEGYIPSDVFSSPPGAFIVFVMLLFIVNWLRSFGRRD